VCVLSLQWLRQLKVAHTRLPSVGFRNCYQFRCLVNRGTICVNSLPKTVTRQRRGCDLNPGPSAPESRTLTTRLVFTEPPCATQTSLIFFWLMDWLIGAELGKGVCRRAYPGDTQRWSDVVSAGHAQRRRRGRATRCRPHPGVPVAIATTLASVSSSTMLFPVSAIALEWHPNTGMENAVPRGDWTAEMNFWSRVLHLVYYFYACMRNC